MTVHKLAVMHPSSILSCVTAVSGGITLSEREGTGSHLATCDDQNWQNGRFWPKCQHRNRGTAHRNTSSELLQEEGTEHVRIQLWIQRVSQIPLPVFRLWSHPCPYGSEKELLTTSISCEEETWASKLGGSCRTQWPGSWSFSPREQVTGWEMSHAIDFLKGKEDSWGKAEKTFRQLFSLRQK